MRLKKSFGIDPLLCPICGDEMEFEGIWHPEYGWIVDNFDSFFVDDLKTGGRDGERGPVGSVRRASGTITNVFRVTMKLR